MCQKIRSANLFSINALPNNNKAVAEPKKQAADSFDKKIAPAAMIKAKTTAKPANPSATMVTTAANMIKRHRNGAAQQSGDVENRARQPLFVEARAFFASFTA